MRQIFKTLRNWCNVLGVAQKWNTVIIQYVPGSVGMTVDKSSSGYAEVTFTRGGAVWTRALAEGATSFYNGIDSGDITVKYNRQVTSLSVTQGNLSSSTRFVIV